MAKKKTTPAAVEQMVDIPQPKMRAFFPCCGKWFEGVDRADMQEQVREYLASQQSE